MNNNYREKGPYSTILGSMRTIFLDDRAGLDPKCDIVFKAIFTHGKEGKLALLGLINAVLAPPKGERIVEVEYINTHAFVMFKNQKKPVMDIMVRTEDDRLINIEMQVDDKDNFFHRTQHYLACMLHDQSVSGDAYDRLKPCIAINILDYSLDTGLADFHTCYRMQETSHLLPMPHHLSEIHYIELPKLLEYILGKMPDKTLARWAFYFKDLPENKHPEILAQILAEEKEINMAEQTRIKISLREKFLYAYRSYQRAKWDERSSRIYLREKALREGREEGIQLGIEEGIKQGIEKGIEQGIEQGIEKGIEQGIEKGIEQGLEKGIEQGIEKGIEQGIEKGAEKRNFEIAAQMLAQGIEIGIIEKVTSLSAENIRKLENKKQDLWQ